VLLACDVKVRPAVSKAIVVAQPGTGPGLIFGRYTVRNEHSTSCSPIVRVGEDGDAEFSEAIKEEICAISVMPRSEIGHAHEIGCRNTADS